MAHGRIETSRQSRDRTVRASNVLKVLEREASMAFQVLYICRLWREMPPLYNVIPRWQYVSSWLPMKMVYNNNTSTALRMHVDISLESLA